MRRILLLAATVSLAVGCSFDATPDPHPLDVLRYPGAAMGSADGSKLYVVGTNFDRRYATGVLQVYDLAAMDEDLGDPALVVNPKALTATPSSAVRISSFGGRIARYVDGTDEHLFIPTRSTGTLAQVTVGAAGTASCPSGAAGEDCTVDEVLLDVGGGAPMDDPFAVTVAGGQIFVAALSSQRIDRTDSESPFQVFLAQAPADTPEAVTTSTVGLEVTRDLATGPAGLVWAAGQETFSDGSGGAVLRTRDPAEWAGGGRSSDSISLRGAMGALDARALAFSSTGDAVYVVTRRPSALGVFDQEGVGADGLVLRGAVALPESPSRLAVIPGPKGDLVVVSATGDDTLVVVDAERLEVVGLIDGTPCEATSPCPGGPSTPEDRPATQNLGDQPYDLVVTRTGSGGARIWLTSFGDEALPSGSGTLRAVDLPDLNRPWEGAVRAVASAPDEDANP